MHKLEGPKCTICHGDPSKFTEPTLKALVGKVPGQMESLRLVSIELEATTEGINSARHDDAYFDLDRGAKRHAKLPPEVYKVLKAYPGTGIGRDRPGPCGFEICTMPASGTKAVNQFDDWETAFESDDVYVTDECGAHVHTDARDFCMEELAKLMMSYRAFQPALYRMIPSERRRDRNEGGPCARIVYEPLLVKKLIEANTTGKIQTFLRARHLGEGSIDKVVAPNPFVNDRHVGCNVALSFNLHRTVEWRIPPGVTLASDMIGWARMFAKIMDWVKDLPSDRARTLVRRGWVGRSSTEKLKEILNSSRCDDFIDEKQEANRS